MKVANSFVILLIIILGEVQPTAVADDIEVKFVVKEAEVEKAIQALGLDNENAERKTSLTRKNSHFSNRRGTSVILRARTTRGERNGETTVKLRSKDRLKMKAEWKQDRRKGEQLDYKCEKDQVVRKPVVHSYSLDDKEDAKAIQETVADRQPLKKIFSSNQQDLVEQRPSQSSIGDKLEALGPVKITRWHQGTSPAVRLGTRGRCPRNVVLVVVRALKPQI